MAIEEQRAEVEFPHRLLWFAARAEEVLDDVLAGGVCVGGLPAGPTADAVTAFTRLASRMQSVANSLLAHAEAVDVAASAAPAATSTGAWLAGATRVAGGQAHRMVKLAKRVDTDYRATGEAALSGEVSPAQVEVIVTALDGLPQWVDEGQRLEAERHLLGLATRHDAKALKMLARHLLHVIDPEAADFELARRLEAEEAAAARKTMLKLFDDGDGTCHGWFRIPSMHGAMLTVALDALASPKRPDRIPREEPVDAAGDPGEVVAGLRTRTAPEVLGEAFCQLLERFPARKLPRAGGGLATVLVTMSLEVLEGRLGIATLSNGGQLSAGAARRLACHHGLIAQVLGARSEPLDQSRRTRLHTEPQRIAMAGRDKVCTAEGCTVPAAWCHAHHVVPWSSGGRTSVKDGRMVCPRPTD